MRSLLFLAHRIPFPPNKGDKIRSWHALEHLASRFRLHLGCLVDDPADWQHVERLQALCASSCFVPLHPVLGRLASLRALLTGDALSIAYFQRRRLRRWVESVHAAERIDLQYIFCSAMAPYAGLGRLDRPASIVDFVDVDSAKWAQYAGMRRGPRRWIYQREARTLGQAERLIAAQADLGLFATPEETDLFRRQWPSLRAPLRAWANGVDTDHFDPAARVVAAAASPFAPGGPVLLFTGAMDYWANIDAVTWFADQVMPGLRRRRPDIRFCIAGSRPAPQVQRLAARPGIQVTGFVEDLRPCLRHAAAVVAPLRVARGIQNKVLEAMAMAAPTIVSPGALTGIAATPGTHLQVADAPEHWVEQTLALLRAPDKAADLGANARRLVVTEHSWMHRLDELDRLIDQVLAAHALTRLPSRLAEVPHPGGLAGASL